MSQPWFRSWFGEAYLSLYGHRDDEEAAQHVDTLLRAVQPSTSQIVLDIACGAGRHLTALRIAGLQKVYGIDLSATLLKEARSRPCDVARCDMRILPFADQTFAGVTNFFTSFGYFPHREDDAAVLGEFARVLCPGGWLWLDLPDREHVLRHLVEEDEKHLPDWHVHQKRRVEEDVVIKSMVLIDRKGHRQEFEERVRLHSFEFIENVANHHGLLCEAVFGDVAGGSWKSGFTPRMTLLLRKVA